MAFTHKARVRLPDWEILFGFERFRNHVTFGRNKVLNAVCTNHNQTRGAGNSFNNIPVGLAGRICGFHPPVRVRLPDWDILFGLSISETTLHLAATKYSIPSAQTTTKHEALEILINKIPVGLAVRICGFHPQGPGSTPGLGNFVRI